MINVNHVPLELLKKAVNLRNCSRRIFIALCNCEEPKSSSAVAKLVGESRPYVNMRLNQLVEMGYVRERKGEKPREKLFEVVR